MARREGLDGLAAANADSHVAGTPHDVARDGLGCRLVAEPDLRGGAVADANARLGVAPAGEAGAVERVGSARSIHIGAANARVRRGDHGGAPVGIGVAGVSATTRATIIGALVRLGLLLLLLLCRLTGGLLGGKARGLLLGRLAGSLLGGDALLLELLLELLG